VPATGYGPTTQQVVDDFAAAGLAMPNPRDNTSSNCPTLGCTQQLVTTDALSVVQSALGTRRFARVPRGPGQDAIARCRHASDPPPALA
jgi:hypothetical protein